MGRQLTVGSLFSGIGGFDLGLERAGMRVAWQSEIDEFACAVLRKHWPNVTNHGDVRTIVSDGVESVDVICGGFPCQDVADSNGIGLDGSRSGLWFQMLRIVREFRPRFVIVENVSDLATRGLGRILGGLSESGFDAFWLPVRASAVGLPHIRERLFVVAYANGNGFEFKSSPRLHVQREQRDDTYRRGCRVPGPRDRADAWNAHRIAGGAEPGICRGVNGFPSAMDRRRLATLGNAIVPDVAEIIGRAIMSAEQ